MYRNLRAEIARQGLTLEKIVEEMRKRGFNLTIPMLSDKLNGKYKLYFGEAKAIRDIVAPDVSLDVLFEEAV